MQYFTINKESSAEFEEKKSVFIGQIKRVFSEEEAKAFLDSVRKKHREARHNVYAYALGPNKEIQRYSDDGEPQGTGGVPILETIKKSNITDVMIIVTRYFGGILLGTGGLSRAYGKSASLAIKEAGIIERVKGFELEIAISYDFLGKVQHMCNEKGYNVVNTEYTDKVAIKLYCESNLLEAIKKEIAECTFGSADIRVLEETYFYKMEDKLILAS